MLYIVCSDLEYSHYAYTRVCTYIFQFKLYHFLKIGCELMTFYKISSGREEII